MTTRTRRRVRAAFRFPLDLLRAILRRLTGRQEERRQQTTRAAADRRPRYPFRWN